MIIVDDSVAMNVTYHQPGRARAQPTVIRKIEQNDDGVMLVFSFPIKYRKSRSFLARIPLKTSPGVMREFK